jgi:hypothetical protein
LTRLDRRTIPYLRVRVPYPPKPMPTRQGSQASGEALGMTWHPVRYQGLDGRSERWEAAPNKPQADMVCYHPGIQGTQRAEKADAVGFGVTAGGKCTQERCGRRPEARCRAWRGSH